MFRTPSASSHNKPSFIEQIINEALPNFIPGNTNTFKLFFKKNTPLRPGSRSYPDPNFRCDANPLPDTNIVASVGPQFADMENFFLDTALNETKPIERIVALCDPKYLQREVTEKSEIETDSFDYFKTPREFKVAEYQCTLKRLAGLSHLDEVKEGKETKEIAKGLIQSELEIKSETVSKKLQITFFEVMDGTAVNLVDDYYKKVFWDLHIHALSHPLLVHCRQGIGRTGSFILSLEILKLYDELFASQNPKMIADNILGVLKRLRTTRPALILAPEQLSAAIHNAYLVRQYALEQGYFKKHKLENSEVSNNETSSSSENNPASDSVPNEQFDQEHSNSTKKLKI